MPELKENEMLIEIESDNTLENSVLPSSKKLGTSEQVKFYYPLIKDVREIIQKEIDHLAIAIDSKNYDTKDFVILKNTTEAKIIEELKKIDVNLNSFNIFIRAGKTEGTFKLYAPLMVDMTQFVD